MAKRWLAAGVAGGLGVVALVALVASGTVTMPRTSRRPLVRAVNVARVAEAEANEREVAEIVEAAIAERVPGARIRSESTAGGVAVVVTLAHEAGDGGARSLVDALGAVRSRLPADASAPAIVDVSPAETFYFRPDVPRGPSYAARPGVVAVEPCGEPEPERLALRVDLRRLDAFGLDMTDVHRAVLEAEAVHRAEGPPDTWLRHDLNRWIRGARLRSEPLVELDAVASLREVRPPPACRAFGPNGESVYVYAARARRGEEAALVEARRSFEAPAIRETMALRVLVGFAPGVTAEAGAIALRKTAQRMRDVKGAALFATLARADGGEILFDQSRPAPPEELAELRAIVESDPELRWRGARGNVGRVRTVEVVLREPALSDDDVYEVVARLGALRGVRGVDRDSGERARRRTATLDREKASSMAVSADALEWLARAVAIAPAPPTLAGLVVELDDGAAFSDAMTVRGRPLATFVDVQVAPAPRRRVRVDRAPARVLELEVDDEAARDRVLRALEATPGASADVVEER